MKAGLLKAGESSAFGICMEDVRAAALGHMRRHVS
jgi:hypothetical protein